MQRRKQNPTNTLEYPKLGTSNRISEYHESRNLKVPACVKSIYNEDSTRHQLSLYKELEKLKRAQLKLERVHSKEKETRRKLDDKWDELEVKELEFSKRVIEYNDFILNNIEKRVRAHQKIKECKDLCQRRIIQKEKLTKQLQKFNSYKSQLEEKIKDYKRYEYFLSSVLASTDLKNIDHLMNRYASLESIKLEILNNQWNLQSSMEHVKHHLIETVKEKSMIILKLSTDMSKQWDRYSEAKVKALKWDLLFNKIKAVAEAKSVEIITIDKAADDIYKNLCDRRKIKYVAEMPTGEKLNVISESMYFLKKTLKVLTKPKKSRISRSLF